MITIIEMGIFNPILIALCGVLMVVLRAGASRVFFDVVGTFQSQEMLKDTAATMTTFQAMIIDGLSGIEEAGAMVTEQMDKIVDATVPLSYEIEKAEIQFEKFIDTALPQAEELTEAVQAVGMQFGFSASASLDAGARMAQLSAVMGQDVIPEATQAALAFGLMGDMLPEDAMIKLINLQQQTQFLFRNVNKETYDNLDANTKRALVLREMSTTLNQLNSVEDHSAATLSKITGVMNEFASQAHLTGEEIGFMAAMSATLIESGEEQGKAGRALRMIYARLGADTGGAASAIEALGVSTTNADGSLRKMSEILADLMPLWDRMNSGQKQHTAQMIAGNRHYVRFIKLAEGYDRVLSLNQEALQETAPVMDEFGNAMGFLEELTQSNAIMMDIYRERIEKLNAEIGDHFIPGQVEALRYTMMWKQGIVSILDEFNFLGDSMSKVLAIQEVISSTIAPFFSGYINIKAMNVALMTQLMIMRALTGSNLAKSVAERRAASAAEMGASKETTAKKEVLNLDMTQSLFRKKAVAEATTAEQRYQAELDDTIQHKLHLKMLDKDAVANNKTRYLSLLPEGVVRDRLLMLQKKSFIADKERVIAGAAGSKALTNATRQESAAKTRLNAAIDIHNTQMDEDILLIQMRKQHSKQLVISYDQETDRLVMHIQALKLDGEVIEQNTNLKKNNALASMRMSMAMMQVGAVMMMAEMAVMAFGDKLPGIESEAEAMRLSMIMMGLSMAFMGAEAMFSTGMIMNQAMMADANKKITDKNIVSTTLWGSAMRGTGNAALFLVGALRKLFVASLVGAVFVGISMAIERMLPSMSSMDEQLEDMTANAMAMSDELEKAMVAATAEQDAMFLDLGLDEATEQIREFAGAREELFFGFKAGQVTGDLVKQVQQTGVENFIANTEVIQTNNFNGMTTQEAAEEILNAIEMGASSRGIVLR